MPAAAIPPPRLVDLPQPLPGQEAFVSCWVQAGPGPRFVVDPGPLGTIPLLERALDRLGVDGLDLILLTHVHLDHAGGAGALLRSHPGARVVCSEAGAPHLVDPRRLWAGSRRVLGPAADVYGPPAPVPAPALATAAEVAAAGIGIIPTPGHAAHHVCFLHGGTLYAGEAAGTRLALPDGRSYLRPATPPRFRLEAALASLDRLLALSPEPRRIAFGHHGLREGRTAGLLRQARAQLLLWVETARAELAAGGGATPAAAEALRDRIRARLLQVDPHFRPLLRFPPDVRRRERTFTHQTLTGILDHLAESSS